MRAESGRAAVRGGGGGAGKGLMPAHAPTTKVLRVGVHGGMPKGKGEAPARTTRPPVASEVGSTTVSSTAASSEPHAPARGCRGGSGW